MCFSNYLDSELLEILSLRGTFFLGLIFYLFILEWYCVDLSFSNSNSAWLL
ncbi:hypothetical protein JHK87_055179 [Glycine soja]|nr:hypothetical protein JHK87_055179 [Glycine soja]